MIEKYASVILVLALYDYSARQFFLYIFGLFNFHSKESVN